MSRPLPDMDEVAPGVVMVTGTHVNWVLVIDGQEVTLVDSGYHRDAELVRASLAAVRTRAPKLAAVVLTHAHADHLGSANRLHAEYGVPVVLHPAEVPHVRGDVVEQITVGQVTRMAWRPRVARWSMEIVRAGGPKVDRVPDPTPYRPGEPLDVPGGLVGVPTPGHTTGHSSYHLPGAGVLLAGDCLATEHAVSGRSGPQLLPAAFQHDAEAARASLAALEPLAADVVVPGHGPAFRGSPAQAVRLALGS